MTKSETLDKAAANLILAAAELRRLNLPALKRMEAQIRRQILTLRDAAVQERIERSRIGDALRGLPS